MVVEGKIVKEGQFCLWQILLRRVNTPDYILKHSSFVLGPHWDVRVIWRV